MSSKSNSTWPTGHRIALAVGLFASSILVACGGSNSGGGYDPGFGGPGALDRSSYHAQKLMSVSWCSDRGPLRTFRFLQSGDLHMKSFDRHSRVRRGPRREHTRGTWGLQESRLTIQAPGLTGVYYIADNPRPNTLILKLEPGPDGMDAGAIRLKSCAEPMMY